MARAGVKRLPVVAPDDPGRLVGIVAIGDLLQARQRIVIEEDRRERFFGRAQGPSARSPGDEPPDRLCDIRREG